MSRNGNGQYTLPAGNPVVTGTTITSDWANTTLGDIATALTGSVAADGQTPMSGTLDMSNNKITGLIDGTNPTDAATVRQINNPSITGGTINGAVIGNTNPKDGNFLALTANSGDFSASLTAPTITPATDESTNVATTQFVQNAIAAVSAGVTTFNGRAGNVDLLGTDVDNALGYTPYNAGTDTVLTSANYTNYAPGKTGTGASGNWGISISGNAASANNANTVDNVTSAQVTGALGFVPLAPNNPALLGTPTAPTAATGTNTTQIATTAFVLANAGGGGAVSSVNGKTGAVTLNYADVGAYAATNPSSYTTLTAVAAQGYTTQAWVQSQGYVTSSALSTYVTTNTTQSITGVKTFTQLTTLAATTINGAFTINNLNINLSNAGGTSGLTCDNSTTSGVQLGAAGYGCARYSGSITMLNGAKNAAINANGDWTISGNGFKPGGGAWADSSDIRLKSNVQTLTTCLNTINALNPVMFTWDVQAIKDAGAPEIGFIANEVELVIPSAVSEMPLDLASKDGIDRNPIHKAIAAKLSLADGDTIKTVGWKNDIFAYMVGAIQELSDKNDALEARVAALEAA